MPNLLPQSKNRVNRGFKKGDRIQVRGGNVLLGAYGTIVSDTDRSWGKVDVLIDGYTKPRAIEFSRLTFIEQSNIQRSSQMDALIESIGPINVTVKNSPKTQWIIEQETILRKRLESVRAIEEKRKNTYINGKIKARDTLDRLKVAYPTQEDLDTEEASIHYRYDIRTRKIQERKQKAFWT